MTEAGISTEPPQSTRSTPVAVGGVLANISRSFAEIRAAIVNFLRPSRPGSGKRQAESGGTPEGDVATPGAAGVNVDSGPQIKAGHVAPDQQEIERRRSLVRMLFNDFWDGVADKPAAFVERLDRAEDYLNKRLAADGELWRVDANTRLLLGLPPRAKLSGPAQQTS